MKSRLRFRLLVVLLCVVLAVVTVPVQAQWSSIGNIGPSKGEVAGVIVGIVAVGVAIGVGVYFLVRKSPSVTGCAVTDRSGLELQNEGDQQRYLLTGDTANIKSGDRVKVSGKREKKTKSGERDFLVEKVSKDYGHCKVSSATS